MYPIIVSDLDGTLLGSDHEITSFTQDTLLLLAERGIKFIMASGRHYMDVEKIRERLGLDIFLITSNGARVHNKQGEVVFRQDIPVAIVEELLELPVGDDICVNVFQEERWLANRERPELLDYNKDSGFYYQICDLKAADKRETCKVFFSGSPDKLHHLAKALEERFAGLLSIAFSTPECLEVMDQGVSKGHALAHVVDLKGHTLEDCIAFGDGMNDREMLSCVGRGVVMENAPAMLKQALPHFERAQANTQNGVAHYLRQLYRL